MFKRILSSKLFSKVKVFVVSHKIISLIIILVLAFVGYKIIQIFNGSGSQTRYVTAAIEQGTIISSVSGSGQVSASNQVDIKPSVSGTIVSVNVKQGDAVIKGQLIAQLDSGSAYRSVRDAQASLESAKLSLEKLRQPADQLTITQAENALSRSIDSKQNAVADLARAYDDGFTAVSNAFLDLPDVMTGLQTVLFSGDSNLGGQGQWNIDYYTSEAAKYDSQANTLKADAYAKYDAARQMYDKAFQDYKATNRSSDKATIESVINEAYNTSKSISEAIKSGINLIQFYKDTLTQKNIATVALADTHLSSLGTYTNQTNSNISSLLSAENTITSDKDAITNADQTITENTQSLAKLKSGADPLDIKSAQLTIQQRENALADAQAQLADYYIRAPFAGVIANVDGQVGQAGSSGTAIATEITTQKMAEVALNEIDIAKVKVGLKATLTFDAIPDLTITGEVVEVDTIGTVSQGVVSYNVKIGFDVQDSRIKPGMSFSASIITASKQDVLVAPSSAVKTANGSSYVQILVNGQPQRTTVTTGLSNDTSVEIVGGLQAGDEVITQTITNTNTNTAARTTNRTQGGQAGGAFFQLSR